MEQEATVNPEKHLSMNSKDAKTRSGNRKSSRGVALPGACSTLSRGQYVVSGVRPSSGAETLENDATCEISDTLERAEVAAAEDGRTPVNRYGGKGRGEGGRFGSR